MSVWDANNRLVESLAVDIWTGQATGHLPTCPKCGKLARPQLQLFDDFTWVGDLAARMQEDFEAWLRSLHADTRLVIIELGVRPSNITHHVTDFYTISPDTELTEVGPNLLLGFRNAHMIRISKDSALLNNDERLISLKQDTLKSLLKLQALVDFGCDQRQTLVAEIVSQSGKDHLDSDV